MTHSVGTKGQVVITKEIRDKLGIGPGWVALQRLAGDHVEIYFVPPPHRKSLRGILASDIHLPPEKWHEAREKASAEAARRKMDPEAQD